MKLPPLLEERRTQIMEIAARHGARNLRVFGSFSRGDAGPDSDVDFVVDAGPETSAWFPGGLVFDLEELLRRRVDVVEETALRPELRARILAEAQAL